MTQVYCPNCKAEMHLTKQESPIGFVMQAYCLLDGFILTTPVMTPETKQPVKQEILVDWDMIHKLANE